jgi:integrase
MKLSNATVGNIPAPASKFEVRVFDEDLPGFGVRVLAAGKRSWIIQFRINGRSTTKTIGRVEKMSAGTARDLAKKQLHDAERGINPAAEKRAARDKAADTFKALAARYLGFKEKDGIKASSYAQIKLHLTDHWATFDSRSVHDISRRDIATQLVVIADERGAYAANRARTTISGFYGWLMGEGIVEANPVVGINKQTNEQARDRVLTNAELVAIWKASNDDDYGNIVRLLVLTGQRRDEVGAMTRSEIDLSGRKWTIPGARTKNSIAHEVPLSNKALEILKPAMAREGREDRPALFGDSAAGKGFSGWSKAKAALDQRIEEAAPKVQKQKGTNGKEEKRQPWRIHDVRRTVATRMADLGVLPHVIEAVLNQISGHKAGVAGVYNRATYAPEKRQALDLWAAHVEALLSGKPASNIVALKA